MIDGMIHKMSFGCRLSRVTSHCIHLMGHSIEIAHVSIRTSISLGMHIIPWDISHVTSCMVPVGGHCFHGTSQGTLHITRVRGAPSHAVSYTPRDVPWHRSPTRGYSSHGMPHGTLHPMLIGSRSSHAIPYIPWDVSIHPLRCPVRRTMGWPGVD